jgi:hypothetical protein
MDLARVLQALKNADAAGDTAAAQQIAQLAQQIAQPAQPEVPEFKRDYTTGEMLSKAVVRSAKQMGSAFGDVIPAMGASALGFDDYAKRQMQEAAETKAEIERNYAPQYRGTQDVTGLGSGLGFAAESIAEQIPNIATALVPGLGAAALATRAGLGVAGRAAAVNAGTFLGSYSQTAPEIFQNIYETTGKMEPGVSALFGAGSAALDSILPARLANSITGPLKAGIVEKVLEKSGMDKGLLRSVTAGMVKGVAGEGLTEGAQEGINIAAERFVTENPEIFGSKEWDRIMQSAVKGAIAGGAFGSVSGGVEASRAGTQRREEYAQALEKRGDRQAAAEVRRQSAEIEAAQAQNPQQSLPGFEMGPATGLMPTAEPIEPEVKVPKNSQAEMFTGEGELAPGMAKMADKDDKSAGNRERLAQQREAAQLKEDQKALKEALSSLTATPTDLVSLAKTPLPIQQTIAQTQGEMDTLAAKRGPTKQTAPPAAPAPLVAEPVATPAAPIIGADKDSLRTFGKTFGIGPTAKILRVDGPLAGKDISDPAQAAEVRTVLEAYASGTPAVGAAEKIETYLKRPEFQGTQNATRPDTPTGGGSPSVVSEPISNDATGTNEATVGDRNVSTQQDAGDATVREGQQPTTLTEETPTDGTTTTKTQQAEPQRQEAPAPAAAAAVAPARGTSIRPDLSGETPVVNAKLGQRGVKLDAQSKDARAYFGKLIPELALDAIANDLVLAPTAYRNSKMKAFEKSPQGPEPMFGTEAEAAFFKGQGGIHAKNAAAWARANLSPEAVAFMDQKIALYTKENKRGEDASANLQTQQNIRKATEEQVVKKPVAPKKKSKAQDVVDDPYYEFEADADFAAVHSQAHPVVLHQLENNNLSGALQALADSGSSKTAELFAENLSKLVGNVNLVYGAEKSMYDPATNTIYLRDGATEYEILHESSHATMSHTLDNPSHPVTRQVTNIFNQMKTGTEGSYGAQNIQEFTAEAWSNDAFRNRLKEFKPTGEKLTGWERLVNAVRQLLRLPPKHANALDAVDRMLNDIISPPPETRTGETLYAQSLNNPNIAQEIFTKVGKIARSYPIMNSERAVGFWKAAEKIGTTGRQLMYKSLNLSALGDVGGKVLGNSATRFANAIEEMAGYQEKLLEAMHPLHDRLAKFRQAPEYQTWSTLVNDSTRVDVNPEAKLEKYKGSPEKEADWKQLYGRFNKLTPEGKKLYHDLFATYKQLDEEFLKSLERNINATVGDRTQATSAYQRILSTLADVRIDHYAPLFRDPGNLFWMQYDLNGENRKETFESQAERDFARKQLEARGATNVEVYSRADQLTTKTVPSGTMLADIMKIMKDNQIGDTAIDNLIQLVVNAMPEASILKSRQKRTGIGGYIDNAAYVFDRVSSNTSRQLARMQYGPELQRLVGEMEETVNAARGDVNTYGAELIKEFEGRRNFAMKPTLSSFSQYASTGAFYFNLAGNVSSAVINTLQTPLVVFPQLGGEYGFKDSYAALKNAMKLYTSSGFSRDVTELTGEVSKQKAMTSIENLVNSGKTPQYKDLIGAMKDRGLLSTSTARDALHSENKDSSIYGSTNKLARQTALVGSFLFNHAERMNREVTAVAAYDLEMGKLKNSSLSEAEKQAKAINKALSLVEYAHGAGSTLSGPSLGQGDIGKVLMVFKRFAFSMYYMLFDTMMRSLPVKGATGEQLEGIKAARKQLAGVYGMAAIFAGAKGLPLYWVAELAYNMFQDKDDDDFDTVMRGFLGDLPFKGPVNYLTNLSIADRVGWTDLLWREQKGSKADASAMAQIAEALGGAPYSIGDSLFRAKSLIAEGQYERGVEAALPIGLRNILKGYRYATEGANTLRGDTVGEVNGANAAMQVLGFAPADLMKQYEENAYMTEKGKAIKGIEKNALKKYYAAMREGDSDGMMDAREKLFELGAKYPDLKVSESTILQSVKARDRISREMHTDHGVLLDRKLAPYLRQAAAEAYGD